MPIDYLSRLIHLASSHWARLWILSEFTLRKFVCKSNNVGASAIGIEEFMQEAKNVSEHESGRTFWNPTLLRCWSDLWRYDQHREYGVNSCLFLPLHSCRRLRKENWESTSCWSPACSPAHFETRYLWVKMQEEVNWFGNVQDKSTYSICTDASSCIQERLAGLVRLKCASGAWT